MLETYLTMFSAALEKRVNKLAKSISWKIPENGNLYDKSFEYICTYINIVFFSLQFDQQLAALSPEI